MKRILGTLLLAVLVTVSLTGCAGNSATTTVGVAATAYVLGEQAYEVQCVPAHGPTVPSSCLTWQTTLKGAKTAIVNATDLLNKQAAGDKTVTTAQVTAAADAAKAASAALPK